MIKEDCLFCKIAKGEIHSATVYEDSHFTVILDVNPATKGHCLIIPKEHFDNIYDLDGETAGKLFALATCIARAMKDALKCDGLNLVQNNGEVAGQTVNHFHLHLIPRYEGDGLNLNWPQQAHLAEVLNERRNWFGQLEAEYVRDSLHPDNARASKEEDMDVMRQFITQSEGELTRGCLLVLHRIRNNLMHGMKLLEGLDGQIELFRAATAVLESIAG